MLPAEPLGAYIILTRMGPVWSQFGSHSMPVDILEVRRLPHQDLWTVTACDKKLSCAAAVDLFLLCKYCIHLHPVHLLSLYYLISSNSSATTAGSFFHI